MSNILTRSIFTNKEEREIRVKTCESCEHKKESKCGICECWLLGLQKLNISKCPKNKW